MSILEAKKINVAFSGIQILHDVDFSLEAGEINCLCGENGAGKSTLIKVFSGINANYTGDIFLEEKQIKITSPQEAIRDGIYAVQQHRDLAPTLNAVENIFLGNEIYSNKRLGIYNYEEMTKRSIEFISKFNTTINLEVPVSELKVSEQGIIAICKALARNSKILLIDEASAPLDDKEREALYKSLSLLASEGKGIVYITHHLDEVFKIGTSVTVLRDGFNAGRFGIKELDKKKLIDCMTGNAKIYSNAGAGNSDQIGDVTLEVQHLSGKNMNDVSFKVSQGEILGIAGLEGSGKKEVAEACYGIRRYQSGKIFVNGKEIHPKQPIDSIKNNIALVPDNRKEAGLVLCRNISDNMIIAYVNKFNKHICSKRWANKIANNYINEMSIRCVDSNQTVQYLSGGNQQKVLVAKCLKEDSDVLFLIEPTEGIDVKARADLYSIFKETARKNHKAIIIATSDIDELLELSDTIVTMSEGSVINQYSIEKADKQTILGDILGSRKMEAVGENES